MLDDDERGRFRLRKDIFIKGTAVYLRDFPFYTEYNMQNYTPTHHASAIDYVITLTITLCAYLRII